MLDMCDILDKKAIVFKRQEEETEGLGMGKGGRKTKKSEARALMSEEVGCQRPSSISSTSPSKQTSLIWRLG